MVLASLTLFGVTGAIPIYASTAPIKHGDGAIDTAVELVFASVPPVDAPLQAGETWSALPLDESSGFTETVPAADSQSSIAEAIVEASNTLVARGNSSTKAKVPEPATVLFVGTGLLALIGGSRNRSRLKRRSC